MRPTAHMAGVILQQLFKLSGKLCCLRRLFSTLYLTYYWHIDFCEGGSEDTGRQFICLEEYLSFCTINSLFCQGLVALSPTQLIQYQASMIEFEEEGIKHVKMFIIITLAYIIFWGPLFLVTLINISLDWKDAKSSVSHEVDI